MLIDQVVEFDPYFTPTALIEARALLDSGRPAKALALLKRFVYEHPSNADAFLIAADALERLRRHTEALDSLEQCLRLDPTNTLAMRRRATVLLKLDRKRQARAMIVHLLTLEPESSENWQVCSLILLSLNEHEQAKRAAERACQYDSKNARAHALLGRLLEHRGDSVGAIAEYRLAFELDPNDATLRRTLQRMSLASGVTRDIHDSVPVQKIVVEPEPETNKPSIASLVLMFSLGLFFISISMRMLWPTTGQVVNDIALGSIVIATCIMLANTTPLRRVLIGIPVAAVGLYLAYRNIRKGSAFSFDYWQWKATAMVAVSYVGWAVSQIPNWFREDVDEAVEPDHLEDDIITGKVPIVTNDTGAHLRSRTASSPHKVA